jgi:hypothetical protein
VIALRAKGGPSKTERAAASDDQPLMRGELALDDLQAVVDGATGGELRLRDPVWLTHFRLHHRQARKYRDGRMFLAGDAAHIHSPVGGQGMNTGIQDAWNLGWKLALVAQGRASDELLDSYQAERWPVGRQLLRYTDRIFSLLTRVMSANRIAAWFRGAVVARAVPWVFRSPRLRGRAFAFVSELGISYRRSAAPGEGTPRLPAGPRAGDRLPDAAVIRNGGRSHLQREVAGPRYHLLLCGEPTGWNAQQIEAVKSQHADLVAIHHLARQGSDDVLVDPSGEALSRLGVGGADAAAQYLVRPDGYVAARCAGRDLGFVGSYLARWLPASSRARPD